MRNIFLRNAILSVLTTHRELSIPQLYRRMLRSHSIRNLYRDQALDCLDELSKLGYVTKDMHEIYSPVFGMKVKEPYYKLTKSGYDAQNELLGRHRRDDLLAPRN